VRWHSRARCTWCVHIFPCVLRVLYLRLRICICICVVAHV
jgi:hypothetical protein